MKRAIAILLVFITIFASVAIGVPEGGIEVLDAFALVSTTPQITFTSANSTVIFSYKAANTVYVDWGNGTPVEYTSNDTGSPTGEVKVYCDGGITKFVCNEEGLTSLDVGSATAMMELWCGSNQLTSLDVSKNTALTTLDCPSNQLTSLNVSKNTALVWLFCENNRLASLNVSKNIALKGLRCCNNRLASLDVSKNTALKDLRCFSNQLSSLDVRKNAALDTLYCNDNQLTSLDVSKNTALYSLDCYDNQLTSLDVSKNTALAYLDCNNNRLASLDVSKNTALVWLYCNNNRLASLDVSKNTAIESLKCNSNQLTSLDVSRNTELKWLVCSSNQLTSLDVSKDTVPLESLLCESNRLTFADLLSESYYDYFASYHYSPQTNVTIPESITTKETINLSSEYNANYTETVYTWYNAENDTALANQPTNNGGVFSFGEEHAGMSIYCKMTNASLPSLTLTTTTTQTTSSQHTVTLNANGGTVTPESYTVQPGNTFGYLPVPSKTNCYFDGWYTEADGGTRVNSNDVVQSNCTLYAHWTGITYYTITFNANGGTVSPVNISVMENNCYGELPVPHHNGKEFDGWFTEASGGTRVYPDSVVYDNCTLYAHWKENAVYYTVKFDANGGALATESISVKKGDSFGKLPSPTRTGFTFDGWYTAASGGAQVNNSDTVSKDCTIYAHWTKLPATCIVQFDANGGTVTTKSITVKEGDPFGDSLPVPTRKNYTFEGWYTSKNDGFKVDSNTSVSDDWTLYAHWKKIPQYTVTFNANGGKVTIAKITVQEGETYGTLPTPTRAGYYFDGWYTKQTGGTKITKNTEVKGNCTIYAHWIDKMDYVITLNANGGEVYPANISVPMGGTYGTLPTPTRKEYDFDGWYTQKVGGTKVYSTTKTKGNCTLYAHWSEIKVCYTVTFDANGGSVAPSSVIINNGCKYGTLPTPTRTGYTFSGWYTTLTDGTKVSSNTVVNKSHTLYARWSGKTYRISFELNGYGSYVSPAYLDVTYGSNYPALPTPYRNNYAFVGWYTDGSYRTQVTEASVVNTAGNHNLYAKWEEIPEITLTGGAVVPEVHGCGKIINVSGTLTSHKSITNVKVGFYDSNNQWLSGYSATAAPNSTTYNLMLLDNAVGFSKLPEGEYTYVVEASNGGAMITLQSVKFKVEMVTVYAPYNSPECIITLMLGGVEIWGFNGRTRPTIANLGDGCTTGTVNKGEYIITHDTYDYKNKHGAPAFRVTTANGSGKIPCQRNPIDNKSVRTCTVHPYDSATAIMVHQSSWNMSSWSEGCILIRAWGSSDTKGVQAMTKFAELIGNKKGTKAKLVIY